MARKFSEQYKKELFQAGAVAINSVRKTVAFKNELSAEQKVELDKKFGIDFERVDNKVCGMKYYRIR